MPPYKFLHNLLKVLIQTANKSGLQKNLKHYIALRRAGASLHVTPGDEKSPYLPLETSIF
jgi:hypothetical protein